MKAIRYKGELDKDFFNLIKSLTGSRSLWQVWADMIYLFASTLSNTVDVRHRDKREEAYLRIIGQYKKEDQDKFPELLGMLVLALENDPGRDFLGDMFMQLELSNHWHGQFFTPESICRMMAKMNLQGIKERIEKQGWVSVCDPACGAGATLLAFAEEAKIQGMNYQSQILFACQDIDQTAALMCYIQLSLLGCPGYVKIGDTISNPMTGDVLFPGDGDDIWITPFFFSGVWHHRRQFKMLDSLLRGTKLPPQEEPEDTDTPAELPTHTPTPAIIEINKKQSRRQSNGQLMFDIVIPEKENKCS